MRVLETMWHEYEVNRSSSLRIAGPSDSDDTSSSSSSYFMYKLYSGSTKMSKALGKQKIWANPLPVVMRTCRTK